MSLMVVGAGCLVIAVVGGGLKGASIEVPELAWHLRILLALFGVAFIAIDVWLHLSVHRRGGSRGEEESGR
jgi:hypothetical protein